MGQYFLIVNVDREEYLHPHAFRDGMKLRELGRGDVMYGLAVLLADNNSGGGTLYPSDPLIGSWSGDRIVVAGDGSQSSGLMRRAEEEFEDISQKIIQAVDDGDVDWEAPEPLPLLGGGLMGAELP